MPSDSANLEMAWEAHRRRDWEAAYELFAASYSDGPLAGDALEAWSEAAWFTARTDASNDALEHAFHFYLAADDKVRAAFIAFNLLESYSRKGQPSVAAAWARRGEQLLEGEPESYAHGYLELVRIDQAKQTGGLDLAISTAQEAVDVGLRTGDADLRAIALSRLGALRLEAGIDPDGLLDIEEAAGSAIAGELTPFVTGVTYCNMIAACRDRTDYRRAGEWTDAAERWCRREAVGGFPGICRIHRAELTALRGAWPEAEDALQQATVELAAYNAVPPMADGFYAIGGIRLRQGNLEGAEEALRQAHALGRSPQPALAMVRLAQGRTTAAYQAVQSAVAEQTEGSWGRAALLPALVETAVAAGQVSVARDAAGELGNHVEAHDLPALQAGLSEAWGRVLLAEGDAAGAATHLRSAIKNWQEVGAPFEVAVDRLLLAAALTELHDDDGVDLELAAAREAFGGLGASLQLEATERAAADAAARRSGAAEVRMTFMFTDIEGSTALAGTLGNQAWDHLLRWHDETLRGLFARHDGSVVNSTGDGFFVAFSAARRALDCAVAVQRALAEHRRRTGFAPGVRIGLHTADASRHGDDFAGQGVHIAARVAALAAGGEIVASGAVLAEARETVGELRPETLKGVADPVEVAVVPWEA